MRVADYVVRFLEEKGCKHVFMLAGGGMMHLQDALSRSEKIKYVCHHHEQAAGFAADAYARVSEEGFGVVFATSGPGALNTITAIASAYYDSIPIMVIAGQAKLSETRRGNNFASSERQTGTFEADVIGIVKTIVKRSFFVSVPSSIAPVMEAAFFDIKIDRPGPVYIEIPVDIQGASV